MLLTGTRNRSFRDVFLLVLDDAREVIGVYIRARAPQPDPVLTGQPLGDHPGPAIRAKSIKFY